MLCYMKKMVNDDESTFAGKRVVELGCGHGFPGMAAVKFGAEKVRTSAYASADTD